MARFINIDYAFVNSNLCPDEGVSLFILNWINARSNGLINLVLVGDFYETYLEDAALMARLMDLILTSKSAGTVGRIPLCGIPAHAIDRYTSQLSQFGVKVQELNLG